MRQFKRSDRIRSQMLREVQLLLEHDIAADLSWLVTFTDVEITKDLRLAKIFYSVLGDDDAKYKTSEYLDKIKGRVQSQLGRLLRIKHTPEISFEFDHSIEQGIKMERLFDEIADKSDKKDAENF
ncbi:MAG: 30S ribosome-binding factor RbfA [Candidatus Zixiibacteriota bacterium]